MHIPDTLRDQSENLNHQHYHHHLLHHHHHHHHHHPTCGLGDAHVATIAVQRRTRQGPAVLHCLRILSDYLILGGLLDYLLWMKNIGILGSGWSDVGKARIVV